MISLLVVIWFKGLFISLLAQRNEQAAKRRRKGQPFTGSACDGLPSLLAKIGRFGKSLCSAKTFFPIFAALLGLREMAI